MIIRGKDIADRIYKEIRNSLSHSSRTPHLTVFTCNPNFETQKYLKLKKNRATELGIRVSIVEFPVGVTTKEVIESIKRSVMITDGIIVQLPFPKTIQIEEVISAIPRELDIDAMHYDGTGEVLPPVVGAVDVIIKQTGLSLVNKKVVVLGRGRLVGLPIILYLRQQSIETIILDKNSEDAFVSLSLKEADILFSGVGVAGLIKKDDLKEGVVIFDAGTSEEGGELRGDVDPSCASIASVFTPVPGGIGPITVAILLRNLVNLTK